MEKINRKTKIGILILVAVATFYFLYQVRTVLIPFLAGALLAYILFPLVKWAESRGVCRPLSVVILYIAFFTLIGLFFWYTVPSLAKELSALTRLIPGYMDSAHLAVNHVHQMNLPVSIEKAMRMGVNHLEKIGIQSVQNFINSLIGALGSILAVVFAPILAYYFIIDWEKIRDGLLSLLPISCHAQTMELLNQIDQVLSGFIQGHLLVCLIVGMATGLAAYILNIKYFLIIALISGIAELFPYFGPFLAAIPSVALALTDGLKAAIYLGVAILVIQQLESNLLSPRILGNRVGLHPLSIVFSLLAGGELFGLWGILLAVPVAAIARVLIRYSFYRVID
ncbi:MAG: AI-2E family transporter [Chitinophagales bacterium]